MDGYAGGWRNEDGCRANWPTVHKPISIRGLPRHETSFGWNNSEGKIVQSLWFAKGKTCMTCLLIQDVANLEFLSWQAHGSPKWFQPTYNLEFQLTQLIGDYYVRERDGLDNLWILKPWNMARTIDTSVTDNLSAIIRLMETGPKICQKYIEHPALFKGKKFDLRYIVLLRSVNPLEVFLSDVFWVRILLIRTNSCRTTRTWGLLQRNLFLIIFFCWQFTVDALHF